ncbi:MAG TPA: hypothetical protein VIV12_03915 [Streptosporangiaceae bacterium]
MAWGVRVPGARKAAGPAALTLVDGAVPLRPEPALFDAMLEGWRRQQAARRLTGPLTDGRVRLVRRFAGFTGAWPWQWTPGQAARWMHEAGADWNRYAAPRSPRTCSSARRQWRLTCATHRPPSCGHAPSPSPSPKITPKLSVPSPSLTMKPEPRPSIYTGFRTPPWSAVARC